MQKLYASLFIKMIDITLNDSYIIGSFINNIYIQ